MDRSAALSVALYLCVASSLSAQVVVGSLSPHSAFAVVPVGGPRTIINLSEGATGDGALTDAVVRWTAGSAGNCSNAFRLRFFRPGENNTLALVAERGPFSITGTPFIAVQLNPAVNVKAGDVMGLVEVASTNCGGLSGSYGDDRELAADMSFDYTGGPFAATTIVRGDRYQMRASAGPRVLVGTVPVIGFAQGALGSQFRTKLQVVNEGDTALSHITLVFHPAGQQASASDPTATLSLGASRIYTSDDALNSMNINGIGSLDVFATGEYGTKVLTHVFNDAGAAGTNGFSEPMISPREVLVAGEYGDIIFPTDLTNYRMNIGVRTFALGVTFVMRVIDADGHASSTKSVSYPANYFAQVPLAQFISSTGVTPSNAGRVFFQLTAGSMIVYSSTTDNRTNDSMMTVITPER